MTKRVPSQIRRLAPSTYCSALRIASVSESASISIDGPDRLKSETLYARYSMTAAGARSRKLAAGSRLDAALRRDGFQFRRGKLQPGLGHFDQQRVSVGRHSI